jgi:rubrerythrin
MASLKGTRTEKNLLTAFAGESQARNRYTYFAKQAKKDGYELVAHVFEETANHEKEHAKRLFKFLEGGEVEIAAAFPAGVIGSTLENLRAAAEGEHHENSVMYPEFAQVAKEEGFSEIAAVFASIGHAEEYHEERYAGLAKAIESGTMFKRDAPVAWRCRNCGYVHQGTEPPERCPACDHPKAHYEVNLESW